MKIFEKYLFFSILKTSLFFLIGLVSIFAFFQYIDELDQLNLNYQNIDAFQFVMLLLPSYANSLLILSIMMGVVFSLGQLNMSNELKIFEIASISRKKLTFNSIKFSILIAVSFITILELVAPEAFQIANKAKKNALGEVTVNDSGHVWLKRDDNFISLELNSDGLHNVKIFKLQDQKHLSSYTNVFRADFSEGLLNINDSKSLIFDKQGEYILPKNRVDPPFSIELEEINSNYFNEDVKSLSISNLLSKVNIFLKNELSVKEPLIEIISRLIKPFTLLGMLMIAIPFVLSFKRKVSIGNRIFIAISIGTITHMMNKFSLAFTLKFGDYWILGPILPSTILIIIGLVALQLKSKN